MTKLAYLGEEEWHFVPYPEHYREVMDTAGRGHTFERDEVDHRWYWESERIHRDGMTWNTGSPIWFPDEPPTSAYYVRNAMDGWTEWAWVDPRHPRCWTCGRFFTQETWRKRRPTGPCPRCEEGGAW